MEGLEASDAQAASSSSGHREEEEIEEDIEEEEHEPRGGIFGLTLQITTDAVTVYGVKKCLENRMER